MRVVWTLVLMVACNAVGQTGPRGLVGRLVDHDGNPVAEQRLNTLEQSVSTAEDGSFKIRWKPPNTFATFKRDGVEWRRTLQPDDPPSVDVRLPPVRDGEISCRSEMSCLAEVVWDAGHGLTATVDVQCGERTPVKRVPAMPSGTPKVTCATVMGDLALAIEEDADRLRIRSRPQPHPVEVVGATMDDNCRVELFDGDVVDGVRAVGLQPNGDTWAWAVCKDRLGIPQAVSERAPSTTDDEASISLMWADKGVDLKLDPPVSTPRALTVIHSTESGSVVWQIRVEPTKDDIYRLPQLPRGEYRFGLGAPSVLSTLNPPVPEIPGELLLVAAEGQWGVEGGYIGALRLEEPMEEGVLLFEGKPPVFSADVPPPAP